MTRRCRARVIPYRVGTLFAGNEVGCYLWEMTPASIRFQIHDDSGDTEFESPLIGRHNAYNLTAVIAASRALGIDLHSHSLYSAIAGSIGAPGRLQAVTLSGVARD